MLLGKQQLSIPSEDVEDILVTLILDGKVQGRIDQVAQQLELDRQYVKICFALTRSLTECRSKHLDTKRYQALSRWTNEIKRLHSTVVTKAANTGPGSGSSGGLGGPPVGLSSFSMGGKGDW